MYTKHVCPCCGEVNYAFVSMRLTETLDIDDNTATYNLESAEIRDMISEDELTETIANSLSEHPHMIAERPLHVLLRKVYGISNNDCHELTEKVLMKLKPLRHK